jgi:hypothetical protein
MDGAYLARTIGANQNLLDVDRAEILKSAGHVVRPQHHCGAITIVTQFRAKSSRPGNVDRRSIQTPRRHGDGRYADLAGPVVSVSVRSIKTVTRQHSVPGDGALSGRRPRFVP